MRSSAWVRAILASAALLSASTAHAQDAADAAIDAIRRLANIGPNDQRQIKNWIDIQVNLLDGAPRHPDRPDGFNATASQEFAKKIQAQLDNTQNTPAFSAQLGQQMAIVSTERFSRPHAKSTVVRGISRALVDVNRIETVPALIAGLQIPDNGARYLCARGLAAHRGAIAQDANLLQQVTRELGAAGLRETNAAVLGRIYEALGSSSQIAVALPIYLQVFDARLQGRRDHGGSADAAELFAFEFLRESVVSTLNNDQRVELAKRLAIFLRLDATRYNDPALALPNDPQKPDLGYSEREVLERRLDACEAILETIVGNDRGGNIRDHLNREGHAARQGIVDEANKWIGDAETSITGVLNAAPWNVPVGAP